MSIQLASFLVPKGGNTFFLLEDKYLRGGLRVIDTFNSLTSIDTTCRKAGMLVVTQDTKKVYQLKDDLTTFEESQLGGALKARQTATYTTASLVQSAFEEFSLSLGKSALLYSLSVNQPCIVEGFSTASRNESNPYRFISSASHLEDDGSTFMSDGSKVYGRRYSIVANLETPSADNIYWRITNTEANPAPISLTISFLPLE